MVSGVRILIVALLVSCGGAARAEEDRSLKLLPATGGDPLPDPIFSFAGGPGDSVIRRAGGWMGSELRARRDILLVDVRGTGESGMLRCDPIDATGPFGQITDFLPEAMVRDCRERYGDVDLTQYHTNWIVDDIEEIREALGYPQLNLIGVSYGTRAASVYMRRHPGSVRTATLFGMAPVDLTMPLTFARDAQLALDGIFETCAGDADCREAFPDLAGDWQRVLARIDEGPVKATGKKPGGKAIDVEIDRVVLGQTIRYMLYVPDSAYRVPLAVHRAAEGDFSLLVNNGLFYGGMIGDMADGLYLSVSCAEDVVHIKEAEISPAVSDTFLGDYRIRAQQRACELWPTAALPKRYRKPVRTEVPTLIVSGQFDPVTPPYWGERAARHMANSLHLVVPYAAHDYAGLEGSECVDALADEFLRRGSVEGLDTSCLDRVRHPPFARTVEKPLELPVGELSRFIPLEAVEAGVFRPAGIPAPVRLHFTEDGSGLELDEPGGKVVFRRVEP